MSKEFHLNETLMSIGLILVLLFVGVSLIINTSKSCDTYMQFILLGADNETQLNLSLSNQTVLEIRYACTQICINKFYSDSYDLRNCWEQCNGLGG